MNKQEKSQILGMTPAFKVIQDARASLPQLEMALEFVKTNYLEPLAAHIEFVKTLPDPRKLIEGVGAITSFTHLFSQLPTDIQLAGQLDPYPSAPLANPTAPAAVNKAIKKAAEIIDKEFPLTKEQVAISHKGYKASNPDDPSYGEILKAVKYLTRKNKKINIKNLTSLLEAKPRRMSAKLVNLRNRGFLKTTKYGRDLNPTQLSLEIFKDENFDYTSKDRWFKSYSRSYAGQ